MRGSVISFINMKGGVGKTSLAINVGKTLADKENKVLILDMDPQFNATQSLLLYFTQYYQIIKDTPKGTESDSESQEKLLIEENKSTDAYEKLSDESKTITQLFSRTNLLNDTYDIEIKISENLYLIPGDLNLFMEITGDTATKTEAVLNYFVVNKTLEKYNYVIIDCPPTWSILTHASLYASDFYVIPSKVDLYSSVGIKLLERLIHDKIYASLSYKSMRSAQNVKPLRSLGVIFTLVYGSIKTEADRIAFLKQEFKEIDFLSTTLPNLPSVPTRFIMFDEVKSDGRYTSLINAINKITEEIENKIKMYMEGGQ